VPSSFLRISKRKLDENPKNENISKPTKKVLYTVATIAEGIRLGVYYGMSSNLYKIIQDF